MRRVAPWLVRTAQIATAVLVAAFLLSIGGTGWPLAQAPPPAGAPLTVPGAPAPDPILPSRVVLTFAGDPATRQAVTWRTESAVEQAWAEIAPASADPAFVKTAARHAAASSPLVLADRTVAYHETEFTGLTPDTQYAYRVGDGRVWSEWFHFRTAAARPAPFSFLYVGDAQNEIRSLWSRAFRTAMLGTPQARFFIHAGDLVDVGDNDALWGEWFGAGGWANGMLPSVPAVGNHEYGRLERGAPRRLSPFWRPQFALPTHGPTGLEESVYTFDYQGARIIVLNSMEQTRLADQAAWLEARLRDTPQRWTIVAFHHPVFSLATTRDNPQVREAWQPLFERYRVDLVLTGHDHTYGRGMNVAEGAGRQRDRSGTVYVVSVSGPKMYQIGPNRDWAVRTATNTQLVQAIHVEPARLRFEARTVTGELYDAFELRKDGRGRRRFIDRAPALRQAPVAPSSAPTSSR